MNITDFLVVGTARAGTTALHQSLSQHPGLFLPKLKEPCFYCFNGQEINYEKGKFAFAVKDYKKYCELFINAEHGQLKGEMSTPYLFLHSKTIQNIRKYNSDPGDIKIIVVLRDPVERAYSQYLWRVRDGREDLTFEDALENESRRRHENYSFDYYYADRGLYFEQVKDYFENFKNVKIILYEDLKEQYENTLSDLCRFLGVESNFKFNSSKDINASYSPRYPGLVRFLTSESRIKFSLMNKMPGDMLSRIKKVFRNINYSKEPEQINSETEKKLRSFFKTDVEKLQLLTGLDLSSWLP